MQAKNTTSPKTDQRQRLEALAAERQAQLLDPAEAEFASVGYTAASLNRILAAAGMSKGQAYYYITDKADLYRAVIDRAFQRIAETIPQPLTGPVTATTFWPQLGKFFAHLTQILLTDTNLANLARGIYEGPAAQAALAEPIAHLQAQIDRLVTIGQTAGAVRDDIPHSLLVAALTGASREIDSWFARNWAELSPAEALLLNDQAIALIAGMAAPPQDKDP